MELVNQHPELDKKPHPNPIGRTLPNETDPIFFVGIVIFILVVATWGVVSLLGLTRTQQVTELTKKIAQVDAQLKESENIKTYEQYTAIDTVVSHMKRIRDQRYLFLSEWSSVKESVPKDVQFVNVTLSEDGVFRISGLARSFSSVAHFSEALSEKENISMVAPLSVDRQSNGTTYGFSLSFKVDRKQSAKAAAQ